MLWRSFLACVGVAAILWIIFEYITTDRHRHAPFQVSPKIPIVGHALGLAKQRLKYLQYLSKRHGQLPIFSIFTFGNRMYIVSDLDLVVAAQKSPDVSSDAIAASRLTYMAALSPNGTDAMTKDGVEQPFYHDCMDLLAKLLRKPNGGYEAFRDQMHSFVDNQINVLLKRAEKTPSDLHEWIRHEVVVALGDCMYGEDSPFKDPEVEEAFWTYVENLDALAGLPWPRRLSRKAVRARDICVKALTVYIRDQKYQCGSVIIKDRIRHMESNNFDVIDQAKLELVICFAMLGNTTNTMYLVLKHCLEQPQALLKLREEVKFFIKRSTKWDGTRFQELDVEKVQNSPLFDSAIKETLRQERPVAPVAVVLRDTMLADRYHLRAGATIFNVNSAIHSDATVWGSDANTVNLERFASANRKVSPHAMRGFGGGKNLCPGRHVANALMATTLALTLLRCEIDTVDRWELEDSDPRLSAFMFQVPKVRIMVTAKARKE